MHKICPMELAREGEPGRHMDRIGEGGTQARMIKTSVYPTVAAFLSTVCSPVETNLGDLSLICLPSTSAPTTVPFFVLPALLLTPHAASSWEVHHWPSSPPALR